MSNSAKAKVRRIKRSHLTKRKRNIVGQQHWGDKQGIIREQNAKAT